MLFPGTSSSVTIETSRRASLTLAAARVSRLGDVPLRNRPGILIETHMLKEYQPRVQGTYDLLRFALAEVNQDPIALLEAGKLADEQSACRREPYPITFELTENIVPYDLKGVAYHTEKSDVSGQQRVIFG